MAITILNLGYKIIHMETENNAEKISIIEATKVINAKYAHLDGSTFVMLKMSKTTFNDVDLSNLKITNANLSNLEIEGAQLGGAYIHNIGMPPKGHPAYDEKAKQLPLRFEDCELSGSTITNCNLSGVSISDCNTTGMTINGILVEDLLKKYQ